MSTYLVGRFQWSEYWKERLEADSDSIPIDPFSRTEYDAAEENDLKCYILEEKQKVRWKDGRYVKERLGSGLIDDDIAVNDLEILIGNELTR